MVVRNPQFAKFAAGYIFPEVRRRRDAFLAQHPDAQLISLGIGDTTEPLAAPIAERMAEAAAAMGTAAGYHGYGPEKGLEPLRNKIAERIYNRLVHPDDLFISDGAKCDIGRLQWLFGREMTIAVQDPSYPVYIDGSVLTGMTGPCNPSDQTYGGVVYLPCRRDNGFFPDLTDIPRTDLVFICSPNNPTGTVATRRQLEELVELARTRQSIILFDAAYAAYIHDPELPRSIYEIPGAEEVAIEINSFSKLAGFTGIRLGWTVVPEKLRYQNGAAVKRDWERLTTTLFNGANYIAQQGGLAALEPAGWEQLQTQLRFYLENAGILRTVLQEQGIEVYGGVHAPYLWVGFPGKRSWDLFDFFLRELQLVTTPGIGFGPQGEGYLRLSAFGARHKILEAKKRLKTSKFP